MTRIFITLLLTTSIVLAACSNDDPKPTITIGEYNWTSAELQANIAAFIIEHGYEYPVELIAGDTVSLFTALSNDDLDISMELWPGQQQNIEALPAGTIELLGDSLDENWEGWVIPQYVKDANPDLVAVSDLPAHMELFATAGSRGKARFVDCIPGWQCEEINANKRIAYGLEDVLDTINPGSGGALFEDLISTYNREEPWLGYMWGPTKPTTLLDLYVLEEPPWSEACWSGDQGCAYPSSEVQIGVRGELLVDAPDLVEFLRAWDFPADVQIAAETWMENENKVPSQAAVWFLNNFQELWTTFVPDDVENRVLDALGR